MVIKEMTTIQILSKDRDYLERLREKTSKVGLWAVIESLIKVIKEHKFEEEIR